MPDPSQSWGGNLSGTQTRSNWNGSGSQPASRVTVRNQSTGVGGTGSITGYVAQPTSHVIRNNGTVQVAVAPTASSFTQLGSRTNGNASDAARDHAWTTVMGEAPPQHPAQRMTASQVPAIPSPITVAKGGSFNPFSQSNMAAQYGQYRPVPSYTYNQETGGSYTVGDRNNPNKIYNPDSFSAALSPNGQRLFEAQREAALNNGITARAFSGKAGRSSGTVNHPLGNAIDVSVAGPNGDYLPNYQNGPSFRVYENFAQDTKRQLDASGYTGPSRWGGYFSFHDGHPADLMHMDVTPGGATGGGSWATGATRQQLAALGNGAQSQGIGKAPLSLMASNSLPAIIPQSHPNLAVFGTTPPVANDGEAAPVKVALNSVLHPQLAGFATPALDEPAPFTLSQIAAAQPDGAGFAPNGNINPINPNGAVGQLAPIGTKLANLIANRPYDPRTASTMSALTMLNSSRNSQPALADIAQAVIAAKQSPAAPAEIAQGPIGGSYSITTPQGVYIVDSRGQYFQLNALGQYVPAQPPQGVAV